MLTSTFLFSNIHLFTHNICSNNNVIVNNNQSIFTRTENKINVSTIQANQDFSLWYANEFYTNFTLFNQFSEAIKNNITSIMPSNYNPSINPVSNIDINKASDEDIVKMSDTTLNYRDLKNINGWLSINITFNDNTIKNFIFTNFKRNQSCIFINNKNSNGYAIYEAIQNNKAIKLTNNNNKNSIITFLTDNIYYYENFNNPNLSNFTNIRPEFISMNSNGTYKISINNQNGKMFLNEQPITEINNLKFNTDQNNGINPYWYIVIFIAGAALILIIILLIIYFSKNKNRIRVYDEKCFYD